MSERAIMKRRVRSLLHQNWLPSLLALLLALLPVAAIYTLLVVFMRPSAVSAIAIPLPSTWALNDIMGWALLLFSDPAAIFSPLLAWLPLCAAMLGVHVFIGLPIRISTSGYFLAFLRGKNPAITDVFSAFSGRYPRMLGGAAYLVGWRLLWFAVSFLVPTALIIIIVPLVSTIGIALNAQVYVFLGVLLLCVLWYIIFFFVFLNRLLASVLTPICLAAQPRLPAYRAVRLSRRLMRGSKWQFINLHLSFLPYLLPAIIAALFMLSLSLLGDRLGLTDILQRSLHIFCLVLICANQLIWVYTGPYLSACVNAFYIERKREALMDDEVSPDDFGAKPKAEKTEKKAKPPKAKSPKQKD